MHLPLYQAETNQQGPCWSLGRTQVEKPLPGGGPGLVEVLEAKGLDMVRRDWSTLSKDTGNYVLQQILSGARARQGGVHEGSEGCACRPVRRLQAACGRPMLLRCLHGACSGGRRIFPKHTVSLMCVITSRVMDCVCPCFPCHRTNLTHVLCKPAPAACAGQPKADVVEAVHEKLRSVAAALSAGELPLSAFVITKQLTKRPEDYPDAKGQPHVQVGCARTRCFVCFGMLGPCAAGWDVCPALLAVSPGRGNITGADRLLLVLWWLPAVVVTSGVINEFRMLCRRWRCAGALPASVTV